MQEINRRIELVKDSKKKSLFLFGPRQTGKSFLLKKIFPDSPFYNLLLSDVFFKLSHNPHLIREEITAKKEFKKSTVIIDEIQKLPLLLDEVHYLIEEYGIKFILTGSSPRKLNRGDANLLGGRAWTRHLFPLTWKENPKMDLLRVLNFGALPSIYLSDDPEENLIAYCGSYLQEEIQAEGAVRRIDSFSKFLQMAALMNTELINFETIARETGIPARTVREYFFILEDTLMGTPLPPFKRTHKRKAISTAKFYLFDIGVSNTLAGQGTIKPKTASFGKAFEHFIYTELRAFLSYTKDRRPLTFWRDKQGYEVDFIIGDDTAIEVKATDMVNETHIKGIKALCEEKKFKHSIIVSLDARPRKLGAVYVLPYKTFLKRLWDGEY